MALKEDSKAVFEELLGSEVAKQLDTFDDPKKYPKDFIQQCAFFLGKFLGDEIAMNKLAPVCKKYFKNKDCEAVMRA